MTNTYGSVLMAILIASSACLASTQGQSSVAIITGEIRELTARAITFSYQPPSAIGSGEERVVLDSLNRFACELPVVRGTLVRGHYEGGQPRWKWVQWLGAFLFDHSPFIFFVEPGDSLHVAVEEGFFSPSYAFSGPNAGNSRFIAEWFPKFYSFRLDYEDLELEDFKRQIDQRRQDQFEFLIERREQYALSPGFIDYATAYFNYGWASRMIFYPKNYGFANGRKNRNITSEYYDFLQEVPLVDEKAIGVGSYHTFLVRTVDRELEETPKPSRLYELYDLSGLELSEETEAQLDSMYQANRWPRLSQMVDLSAVGLSPPAQAHLDSTYGKDSRRPKLSVEFDLSRFGLSEAALTQLDSFFEKSGRSFRISSSEEDASKVDTTDGMLVFYLPINEQMEFLNWKPKLSAMVDLSAVGLSPAAQAELDSLYEHREPLRLSEKIDLASLGLSDAVQAQLDSVYKYKERRNSYLFPKRYDLAKEKLEGRVLYWFLAQEVIEGFGSDWEAFALAHRKWEDFQQSNPYPEYTEAIREFLHKELKLQPGHLAPDFTLHDLDGQPVSLSQFKGQVVLIDFWASWCGPCLIDLPDLRKIKEKTAALPVVFLNVSIDTDDAAWREAIDKQELKGIHVRADGFGSDVAKSYQVTGIPSYYLVDSQGLIVECPRIWDTDQFVATVEKSL
ncbi:MAG: TlpA disulfide reductase family protein [Gemmatimonadetes bacterium]|nr:TlpA disulfide reductase family protein [Gemmatimonadota bacterium]